MKSRHFVMFLMIPRIACDAMRWHSKRSSTVLPSSTMNHELGVWDSMFCCCVLCVYVNYQSTMHNQWMKEYCIPVPPQIP